MEVNLNKKKSKKSFKSSTIVCGIVCNKCKKTLPPMTIEQHINGDFNMECPHTPNILPVNFI
jgi:hypothetical protein